MKRWLLLLFLFLNCSLVYAVGIGPPRVEVDFQPGQQIELDFFVINTGAADIDVRMEARGDLADLVSFSKYKFSLKPGESEGLKVIVDMPDRMEVPGINEIPIRAMEIPKGGGGMVGAVAGVEAKLNIIVPFEGAFIKADLDVPNIAVGETLPVKLVVENIGNEDIDSLSGSFEIVGQDISVSFDEGLLGTTETREITREIDTSGVTSGLYMLRAVVDYAGNTKTVEIGFGIGAVTIEVLGIIEDKFRIGEIAKLEFRVISKWNDNLEGFAEVTIFDGDEEIDSIRSSQYTFEPWKESVVEVFWDSTENAGKYTARIDLAYGGEHTVEEFEIELVKKRNNLLIYAAILIVIIVWFIWRKRK